MQRPAYRTSEGSTNLAVCSYACRNRFLFVSYWVEYIEIDSQTGSVPSRLPHAQVL